MRLLETPRARLGRAGERPGFMSEQFGLDQRLGKRRAVHHDQRLVPARAQAVEALGDQLLAGPALADDEHRTVERRRAAGPLERVEKGPRLADYLGCALHAKPLANFPNSWQVLSWG